MGRLMTDGLSAARARPALEETVRSSLRSLAVGMQFEATNDAPEKPETLFDTLSVACRLLLVILFSGFEF
jgi:hypothetical protein